MHSILTPSGLDDGDYSCYEPFFLDKQLISIDLLFAISTLILTYNKSTGQTRTFFKLKLIRNTIEVG